MTGRLAVLLLILAAWLGAASPTLDRAKAEPEPEKRSKYALLFARQSVEPMVRAFRDGDAESGRVWLSKIEEAVEISEVALEESGKNARKKPKHFKHAEIETRKLARDLRTAQRQLIFEERQQVDETIEHIEEVNRQLLLSIMARKRK